MTDPYIAAIAAKERAKGLAHVRRINNQWRREVGMPTRAQEQMREVSARLAAATEGFRASMAQLASAFPPAAPDGFNNWEPREPAWPLAAPHEPTPIYAAVVRELGEPL